MGLGFLDTGLCVGGKLAGDCAIYCCGYRADYVWTAGMWRRYYFVAKAATETTAHGKIEMNMKYCAAIAACFGLAALGFFAFALSASANHTHLQGFAWSGDDMGTPTPTGGIGWIALSCHHEGAPAVGDTCATTDFGVLMNNLDPIVDPLAATVELQGYLWSGDDCGDADPSTTCGIGWLSLNRAETGMPPGPPYDGAGDNFIARYDPVAGRFYGWARAVICTGSPPECGGWDGWIKLSNLDGSDGLVVCPAGSNEGAFGTECHGVTREAVASCNLKGHAWGGTAGGPPGTEVIGWISFQEDPLGSGVSTATLGPEWCGVVLPPTVVATATIESWCTGQVFLEWAYTDFNAPSNMDFYQVQVCSDATCSAGNIVWNTDPPIATGGSIVTSCSLVTDFANNTGSLCGIAMPGSLAPNTPYWWRVRAHEPDASLPPPDDWSAWAYGPSASPAFTTPLHNYPIANFSFFPIAPFEAEEVQFTDSSRQFASDPAGAAAACDDGSVTPFDVSDDCLFSWNFNVVSPGFIAPDPGVSVQCVQPPTSCEAARNPLITYDLADDTSHAIGVTLSVIDSDGYDCTHVLYPISVAPELPGWIEISPR